jgi:hypothetical protein
MRFKLKVDKPIEMPKQRPATSLSTSKQKFLEASVDFEK